MQCASLAWLKNRLAMVCFPSQPICLGALLGRDLRLLYRLPSIRLDGTAVDLFVPLIFSSFNLCSGFRSSLELSSSSIFAAARSALRAPTFSTAKLTLVTHFEPELALTARRKPMLMRHQP